MQLVHFLSRFVMFTILLIGVSSYAAQSTPKEVGLGVGPEEWCERYPGWPGCENMVDSGSKA